MYVWENLSTGEEAWSGRDGEGRLVGEGERGWVVKLFNAAWNNVDSYSFVYTRSV